MPVDGNQRVGWLAMVVFYGLNAIDLDAPDDSAYDLVVGMAAGEVTVPEAAERLGSWRERGSSA